MNVDSQPAGRFDAHVDVASSREIAEHPVQSTGLFRRAHRRQNLWAKRTSAPISHCFQCGVKAYRVFWWCSRLLYVLLAFCMVLKGGYCVGNPKIQWSRREITELQHPLVVHTVGLAPRDLGQGPGANDVPPGFVVKAQLEVPRRRIRVS